MQSSDNKIDEPAGQWVWDSVGQRAAAAGEEVVWECTGGHGHKSYVLSDDMHGRRRCQRGAAFIAGVGLLFGSVFVYYNTDAYNTGDYVAAFFIVGLFFLWVGHKLSIAVYEDSKHRRYLLTDRRLFVIGDDSYANIPLREMQWVAARRHRDGSGTVFCHYDSSFVGDSVCVEGIENYEQVEQLIKDHAPALLGRYWQIVLPAGIRRKIRGVGSASDRKVGQA